VRLGVAAIAIALALAGCGPRAVFHAPPLPQPAPEAADPSPSPSVPTVLPGGVPAGHFPEVVNHGPRTGNSVALTFDADMTDVMLANLDSGKVASYANLKVIDMLQERGIPATFFLTGLWALRYPDVARRLADDPNFEIGNHTYRHSAYVPNCYTLPQLPRTEMTEDARRTFDVIGGLGGNQTRYFRFPGLCHDQAALTALAPLGVTVIDGDVVSGDPFATAAAPVINAVLTRVKPGSIIILHITEANAPFTDEALGPILDGLKAKGLQPVRLSQLLG
jgi:peptidoglycan/xylan/chitin deacetylase (PgdA/CDA1 family)